MASRSKAYPLQRSISEGDDTELGPAATNNRSRTQDACGVSDQRGSLKGTAISGKGAYTFVLAKAYRSRAVDTAHTPYKGPLQAR